MADSELRQALADTTQGTGAEVQFSESGGSVPQAPASAQAFEMDNWSMRRGSLLNEEWQAQEIPAFDDAIVNDAHHALFDPAPELADNPADKIRAGWFKQLTETPEYRALHGQTALDPMLSGLAAHDLASQCTAYVAEVEEKQKSNPKPTEGTEGYPGGPGSDSEDIRDTIDRIKSTGDALKKAKDNVDTAKGTAAGLGIGNGSNLDGAALAQAFKRVRNSDFLRKVMAMAGRMICRAGTLQKSKVTAKRGEITGIELGGDLSRLIPRERLALASHEQFLRERAEYRLLRKRSLCYRQRISKPAQAGPIIVSVDESGSMSGDRIINAKALALAMAWIAARQNRWIAMLGFCDGAAGAPVCFPPGHRQQSQLLEWIEQFAGGGTTLYCPCRQMPEEYWPLFLRQGLQAGKTDHLIITDACLSVDDDLRDSYRAFCKRETVKTYGIVIGTGGRQGGIDTVCDKVFTVRDLALDGAAVESMLSI